MSKGGNQGGGNKGGAARPVYPANKPATTGKDSGGGRSNAPAKK